MDFFLPCLNYINEMIKWPYHTAEKWLAFIPLFLAWNYIGDDTSYMRICGHHLKMIDFYMI